MRVSKAYLSILLAYCFLMSVNAVYPQTSRANRSQKKTAQQVQAPQTSVVSLDDDCKPDTPPVPVVPAIEAIPAVPPGESTVPAARTQTAPAAPSQSGVTAVNTKSAAAPCVPGEKAAPAVPPVPAQEAAPAMEAVPAVPAKPCDTGPEYCWERKQKGKIPNKP